MRIAVQSSYASDLLKLAIEIGFDWVYYATADFVRLSVIPDGKEPAWDHQYVHCSVCVLNVMLMCKTINVVVTVCDTPLDVAFILDQSGSIGEKNHKIALNFISNVVSYFNVAPNATKAGLVTFSTSARILFGLDQHADIHSLQETIGALQYPGGYTNTRSALLLAYYLLNPSLGWGARPLTQGFPRIAILITDGKSNVGGPISNAAISLHNSGVQVYTVGIANYDISELLEIASDPDALHVFLLNSFNDAAGFVDFLSFTTCESKFIVYKRVSQPAMFLYC